MTHWPGAVERFRAARPTCGYGSTLSATSDAKDSAPEFGRPDCRSDNERILPTHTVHFVTTLVLVAMRSADVEHWPAEFQWPEFFLFFLKRTNGGAKLTFFSAFAEVDFLTQSEPWQQF